MKLPKVVSDRVIPDSEEEDRLVKAADVLMDYHSKNPHHYQTTEGLVVSLIVHVPDGKPLDPPDSVILVTSDSRMIESLLKRFNIPTSDIPSGGPVQ